MSNKPGRKVHPGMNLNQLYELSKSNPKYTNLYYGLNQIDKGIKQMATEITTNIVDNPDCYYIKSMIMNQCYNLYLYNIELQSIVGASWPLADFLIMCENKSIEGDVTKKIKKMIKKFDEAEIMHNTQFEWKVNWID